MKRNSMLWSGLWAGVSPFALAIFVAAPAAAQTGDSSATALPEVVVTAAKREQSIQDVPMSITAVSGEAMARAGINDVDDLTSIVPGFTFAKSGDSVPVLTIRGVGYFDNSPAAPPAVSVYVDEVPLPFPLLTQGALFDLERVEVLKGPQGTLFGQNSTGGALNIIAAKPQDTFGGALAAGYARFDTYDISGHVTGPISDTLRGRVAVRYENGDGWQRSYTRDDTFGATERAIGRVSLDWDAADFLRFAARAEAWTDKSEPQAPQLIGLSPQLPGFQDPRLATGDPNGMFGPPSPLVQVYPSPPRDPRAADWTPGKNYTADDKYYRLSLRGEFDLSDAVTLVSTTAYQRLDMHRYTEADGTSLLIAGLPADGSISSFYQETRLQGDGDRLSWMIGGNYSEDRTNVINLPEFSDWSIPFETLRITTTNRIKTLAVFGSVDYDLTEAISLHGSARYTDGRTRYRGCPADPGDGSAAGLLNFLRGTDNLVPGGCYTLDDVNGTFAPTAADILLKEDNVSWRLSLNYEPTDDLLVYVNVSKGYKAGAFTVATFDLLSQAAPATQESLLAYEAGMKLTGSRYQVSGAVFYYDYKDKQVLAPFNFGPPFFLLDKLQNVPKSRVIGAEWQAAIYPVSGLKIGVTGTYIDGQVTSSFISSDPIAGGPLDLKGLTFPHTPTWDVGGDVNYTFPLGGYTGSVGVQANYRSSSIGRFGGGDLYKLDARTLVDFNARIETEDGRYALDFWGRNIFNEYYKQTSTSMFDTVIAFTGQAATYGVRATLNF